jgi:cyanophycinase
MNGPLAFVGGGEWQEGCSFDADLLAASGGEEVVVLPTAAAYEHPGRVVERATAWFEGLGARVRGLSVLRRSEAMADDVVAAVRGSRFIYLADGSPLHLRSVLKESPLWDALVTAWQEGAVVAGSGAGAMVLGDPMVDPRGGAFTVGLGLIEWLAVVPHHEAWSPEQAKRTIDLAETGLPIVGIDSGTALLRASDGGWTVAGGGQVTVIVDGTERDLATLPS